MEIRKERSQRGVEDGGEGIKFIYDYGVKEGMLLDENNKSIDVLYWLDRKVEYGTG